MDPDSTGDRPTQVTQMNEEEVEGRLSAHRYILSHLLAKLSTDPGDRKVLLDWLDERASVKTARKILAPSLCKVMPNSRPGQMSSRSSRKTFAGWLN